MTMDEVLSMDPMGSIYSFTDHDGNITHIASTVLRAVSIKLLTPVTCYINDSLREANARGDTGVEAEYALKLADEALEVPILVCEWGVDHVIADGAHRLWRRIQRGDVDFPAYVVPEKAWRHFVITDVPGTTQQWRDFNDNVPGRMLGPFAALHPKNPFKGK